MQFPVTTLMKSN